jgi:hypothetical protein
LCPAPDDPHIGGTARALAPRSRSGL